MRPEIVPDYEGLFLRLEERYPKRMRAVDVVIQAAFERKNTDPAIVINSVETLEYFLLSNAQEVDSYPSEIQVHTSDRLLLIVHPPFRSLYPSPHPFVSVAHHNFTLYSEECVSEIVTTNPFKMDTAFARESIPLEVVMDFDAPEKIIDKKGTLRRPLNLYGKNGERVFFVDSPQERQEVFSWDQFWKGIEQAGEQPESSKTNVFIPLKDDGSTIEDGWHIYALPMSLPVMYEYGY